MEPQAQFSPNYFPPEFGHLRGEDAPAAARRGRRHARGEDGRDGAAQVYVDGQFRGVTPAKVTGLTRAEHYVTVSAPGYARGAGAGARWRGERRPSRPRERAAPRRPRWSASPRPRGRGPGRGGLELGTLAGMQQVLALLVRGRSREGAGGADGGAPGRGGRPQPGATPGPAPRATGLATGAARRCWPGWWPWTRRAGGGKPVTHFGSGGRSAGRRTAGYVLLATGAALLAGGVFFGLEASSQARTVQTRWRRRTRARRTPSDGKTFALVADVGMIAGLAVRGRGHAGLAFFSEGRVAEARPKSAVVAVAPPRTGDGSPAAKPVREALPMPPPPARTGRPRSRAPRRARCRCRRPPRGASGRRDAAPRRPRLLPRWRPRSRPRGGRAQREREAEERSASARRRRASSARRRRSASATSVKLLGASRQQEEKRKREEEREAQARAKRRRRSSPKLRRRRSTSGTTSHAPPHRSSCGSLRPCPWRLSACSLLLDFDPEGQPCDQRTVPQGYVCQTGLRHVRHARLTVAPLGRTPARAGDPDGAAPSRRTAPCRRRSAPGYHRAGDRVRPDHVAVRPRTRPPQGVAPVPVSPKGCTRAHPEFRPPVARALASRVLRSRAQEESPDMGKRVGVLMGGWGEEREISLKTGEAVVAALESRGHTVTRIFAGPGLDRALRVGGHRRGLPRAARAHGRGRQGAGAAGGAGAAVHRARACWPPRWR